VAPVLALGGMVGGCGALPVAPFTAQDEVLDRIWTELARGNAAGAAAWIPELEEPGFRERARRDVEAATVGRSAALVACLDEDSWLAARYLASAERALTRLSAVAEDDASPAVWLELARRAPTISRRLGAAERARRRSPGGAEALATMVELHLAQRRFERVGELLDSAPDTARLRLARRTWLSATGRHEVAVVGLLEDLRDDRAVPRSLELLERLLIALPRGVHEERALALLGDEPAPGDRLERLRRRLIARLLARAGRLDEAIATLAALRPRLPAEERLLSRWRGRAAVEERRLFAAESLEEVIDRDEARDGASSLRRRRLADEWGLAARGTYEVASRDGETLSLDAFVATLDESAETLPGSPRLASLPRTEYGIFGTMLDTEPLREPLPASMLLGGKALGMPPELTWYDLVAAEERPLPQPVGGTYLECRVANARIPGYAASLGARFAGAGLDRVVFLDVEQVALEELLTRPEGPAPPSSPRPARGRGQRRALDEPLDVADRLRRAARADAGDDYRRRLLESLSLHERRHIVDTREFLARGILGQLADIFGAGLLPASVRAEVERRAQLDAMRACSDPRIPLAQAVAYLPVEGPRAASEHARGYGALVAQFVDVLDREAWEGARPLAGYGIRRDRVLVQQLHRLPPETVRAIAATIEM